MAVIFTVLYIAALGSLLQVFKGHLLRPKLVRPVQSYLHVKRKAKMDAKCSSRGGGSLPSLNYEDVPPQRVGF